MLAARESQRLRSAHVDAMRKMRKIYEEMKKNPNCSQVASAYYYAFTEADEAFIVMMRLAER